MFVSDNDGFDLLFRPSDLLFITLHVKDNVQAFMRMCEGVWRCVCVCVTRRHDDPRRPCLSFTFIICVVIYYWSISPLMTLYLFCRPITQMNDRPAQRPKEEKKSSNFVYKALQKEGKYFLLATEQICLKS